MVDKRHLNLQPEPEDYFDYGGLEEEAPDESSSSSSSRPPSPRIIPRRNCAEEAKKKLKIEKGRNEDRQQVRIIFNGGK